MDKLLTYASQDSEDNYLKSIRRAGGSLIKQASGNAWPPEVLDFINKLIPKDDCHYSLCNALGAGEFWSSNVNGDFFEKDELLTSHPTFLNGNPFMHHINKDPNKGYGKILFSAYNPRMNRVELVVEYDTNKLPKDITNKLDKDELVNLSMGCRVPYDTCSICGNKAPTPKDYCDHVTKQGLNYIYPDGRKVFVYNPRPDFFDISIVIVPADKTACVLAKIFGAKAVSKIAADPLRGFREMALPSSVNAELYKAAAANITMHLIDEIPVRSFELIKQAASMTKTPLGLLKAIKLSNAYLKPSEVQAVLFSQINLNKIAKVLLESDSYIECTNNLPLDLGESDLTVKLPDAFSKQASILRSAITPNIEPMSKISMESDMNSVLGLTPDLLDEIARVSMLSALIGKALSNDSTFLIPAIGVASQVAANSLRESGQAEELERQRQIMLARDLYIEPLIRAKKASNTNLTLRELYSIPLMYV